METINVISFTATRSQNVGGEIKGLSAVASGPCSLQLFVPSVYFTGFWRPEWTNRQQQNPLLHFPVTSVDKHPLE